MSDRELAVLEKVFEAEIAHALGEAPYPIVQLRAAQRRFAPKLVSDGLIEEVTIVDRGLHLKGYVLTQYGRMVYCQNCKEKP